MPPTRRLVPLLLTATLAVSPAPALAQGGAGDDQYADPFGGSGSTSSGSSSSGSTGSPGSTGSSGTTGSPSTSGSTAAPSTSSGSSLSQAPSLSSGSTTAPSTAAPTTATGTASVTGELPRTGMDAWAIALLGVGLLVAGIGLRLRTVDGRRA